MPLYSNSKLSTYENCPQQYKLKYIDRIQLPEEGEGIEAFLGSRVHETLEKLYKELILTKLNTLDELLKYYHTQWEQNWHDDIVIVKKGYSREHYRNAGQEAITTYYRQHHPFNESKTLATEQLITFKIDDYTIQGYIDRVSGREKGVYEIHDYKTSGTLPSQEKLDRDRQLALYQIGIKERFRDARDIRLIWHYLLFGKEFTSERTEAQLKDLKKDVVSLIKTIESDTQFEPAESNLCDWCEYPDFCPAKKHERKVQDLPLNRYLKETGVSLVNKYAAIKAKIRIHKEAEQILQEQLDLIAEAAIEFARKEGVTKLTGNDFALKIIEEAVLEFPHSREEGREDLERYIKKAGIWENVSGLNLSRLAKMVENGEFDHRIMKGLSKFAEQRDSVSVRLVKKRKEEE